MDDDNCGEMPWGFVASGVPDPPACIADCRQRFLAGLVPEDETFGAVCEVLSDKGHATRQQSFRSLYCCDSQLCGVDNLALGGLDPNVNWLTNACQNIGYNSIIDPGPPEVTYNCDHLSKGGVDPRCRRLKATDVSNAETTAGTMPSETSGAYTVDNTLAVFSSPRSTVSSTTETHTLSETTYMVIHDPSLAASLDLSRMDDDASSRRDLTTVVKVTIGLSALVGVVAIVALVFCVLGFRSRVRRRRDGLFQHATRPDSSTGKSASPLVSPTVSHTGPEGSLLTPPPRLGERKLLPSVPSPLAPRGLQARDKGPGLQSPISSPKKVKMASKDDQALFYGRGTHSYQLADMSTLSKTWAVDDESTSSHTSSVTVTSSRASAPTGKYRSTVPFTSRHRRNDARFDIHSLASPGPPPTKALPSTPPPCGPANPRHGDIGVAIGAPPRHGVALAQELRDLCELTEEYAREARNSWVGWGGGGVALPKRPRDVSSPMLEEVDLERMGGRY